MQAEARIDSRLLIGALAALLLATALLAVLMALRTSPTVVRFDGIFGSDGSLAANPELSAARGYGGAGQALDQLPASLVAGPSDSPELSAARRYGVASQATALPGARVAAIEDNPELSAARHYGAAGPAPRLLPVTGG